VIGTHLPELVVPQPAATVVTLLFVHSPPTVAINGAPADAIDVGTTVHLTAETSGGTAPLTYTWTKNGVVLSRGSNVAIADAPDAGTFTYAVVVTDSNGVESSLVQATVLAVSAGGNLPGGCDVNCPPPVSATPELDSLLLFGSGLSGLVGYSLLRRRAQK
jgi:hypothetical protein